MYNRSALFNYMPIYAAHYHAVAIEWLYYYTHIGPHKFRKVLALPAYSTALTIWKLKIYVPPFEKVTFVHK